jgi:hypothetical protein
MRRVTAITMALLLFAGPVLAGVPKDGAQVISSTENKQLEKAVGTITFPDGKSIHFRSDDGTLTIACSAVTSLTYTKKSKMLKKALGIALAGAIFTLGLSFLTLLWRGKGHFLVIGYGQGQEVAFNLGKGVYDIDLGQAASCTGKPVTTLQ